MTVPALIASTDSFVWLQASRVELIYLQYYDERFSLFDSVVEMMVRSFKFSTWNCPLLIFIAGDIFAEFKFSEMQPEITYEIAKSFFHRQGILLAENNDMRFSCSVHSGWTCTSTSSSFGIIISNSGLRDKSVRLKSNSWSLHAWYYSV